jgi:glycosyltransferase involved in cell wall biosynthesis
MKISLCIDYGLHASSLTLITQKLFNELAKKMNDDKTFTIAATMQASNGIGDVNQHYDCVSVPNMGGYQFPHSTVLSSKNPFIGIVGIDEVVLGKKVFRSNALWKRNKPLIEEQVSKWKNQNHLVPHIHTSTISDKKQIIENFNIPEENIDVIPYGVDHDKFRPSENKESARNKICHHYYLKEKPYFVHISERNWARKNTLGLFEAFRKAKSNGMQHNLLVVGKNDDVVWKKAKTIPGIVMCGYVSEEIMINIIQGADALLLPSLHEGFGLPLVESMACGIPAITSNVFSPPEIIQDAGLLVDPYNTSDICEKILSFTHNKKLQEDLAQKALERSQDFSWTLTAEKMLSLYRKYTEKELDTDFENDYDSAAYRTLTTVCQIHPDLKMSASQDLLEFDYSRIIKWALEVGLEDLEVQDYLIPLKSWLKKNSE